MTEHLAPEIWHQIFLEACVDGGRTACALSEVSRYFRADVLPIQLDNVALDGSKSMHCFAALLQHRKEEQRHDLCRVHHLFLSDFEYQPETSLVATVAEILSTTAPDLITLTIAVPQNMWGSGVCLFDFPNLQELTIRCPDICIRPEPQPGQGEQTFPSLHYLHVLSDTVTAYNYTQYAPNLTHLRLSSLRTVTPQVYDAVRFAVQPDDEGENPEDHACTSLFSPPPFKLPRNIQKIFIQMDPWFFFLMGRSAQPPFGALLPLDKEKKIVMVDSVPAVIRAAGAGPPKMDERKHWEERIVGGPGCWAEPS